MRDLYLSAYAPTLGTGRALRTYTCVRALAELGPVDFAYVPFEGDGPSPEYQAIPGIEFHEIRSSRGSGRMKAYARRRLAGHPDAYARGVSPEVVVTGTQLARSPGRGRVILGDMVVCSALMPLMRERPVIYNAHNVESTYRLAGYGAELRTRVPIQVFERRLLRRAAESWMVSRADCEAATALAPSARLRYVPNAVDVEAIAPRPAATGAGHTVMMLGDFSYEPNRSALAFLADEVMPRVWAELPEARVALAGRSLDPADVPDPRIETLGFVERLADVYAAADCVAVPLVEGAGTPLKFIEALAYGVPVVATPLAAKGLSAEPGVHYREGRDAAAFAAQVIAVLHDGDAPTAIRARELAEREYSIASLAERIAA